MHRNRLLYGLLQSWIYPFATCLTSIYTWGYTDDLPSCIRVWYIVKVTLHISTGTRAQAHVKAPNDLRKII